MPWLTATCNSVGTADVCMCSCICASPGRILGFAGSKAVGLELRAKWMLAAVRLARQEDGAWRNPTMQLLVQPLGFL